MQEYRYKGIIIKEKNKDKSITYLTDRCVQVFS